MSIPKRTTPFRIQDNKSIFEQIWYDFFANLVGVLPGSITNSLLADMVQSSIKGRKAGAGTGSPQDLTPAEVVTILNGAIQFTLLPGGLIKKSVASGVTAVIPNDYQACIAGEFSILGTGELQLIGTGELAVI